ncbi:MAG: FtsX-like permease family protein, partial [Acidobacteriota bacterium]
GRVFSRLDVQRNAAVAVISHSAWQKQFGGDPSILGRQITVYSNDRPDEAETFQVIGVLQEGFWSFNSFTDLLLPLRGTRRPSLLRLHRGVTLEQAELHLTRLARQHLEVHPDWRMVVVPLRDSLYASIRPALILVAATAFLVLLIAAGNLTVLMLIRSLGRRHEFAIRASLGAARRRILRQLSTENLLTVSLAVGLALLMANGGLSLLAPSIQQQLGRQAPGGSLAIGLDASAVGLICALGLLCAFFLGIGPAWSLSALRISHELRGGGRTQTSRQRTLRNLLVTAEIALSLTLLAGAGLMLRSTAYLQGLQLGFEPSQLLKASLALRERSYPQPPQRIALFDQILQRLEANPSVESAAITSLYPFQSPRPSLLEAQDANLLEPTRAVRHSVSEGYFQTLRIPMLQGRLFSLADRLGSLPVAVLSDRLAQQLWPGRPALGKRLRLGSWRSMQSLDNEPWRTVVGVVGGVRQTLTEENFPDVYLPYRQAPVTHVHLMLRTSDPEGLAGHLPAQILEIDPGLPLSEIVAMREVVDAELSRPRFLSGLLSSFALFALLLAVVGVFTVVSYAAGQSRRETAIRIAMGASPNQVTRFFIRQSWGMAVLGVVLGIIGGALLATAMSGQLYGIQPLDPWTHLTLALITTAVIVAALWIPARRVLRTDPVPVLRGE